MSQIKALEDAGTQGKLDAALSKIKALEDAGTQDKLDAALSKIKDLAWYQVLGTRSMTVTGEVHIIFRLEAIFFRLEAILFFT